MYEQMIRETLAKAGLVGRYDARHVEAWMRVEHSTLDWMSKDRFRSEVLIAVDCIREGGLELAEQVAISQGFTVRR